VRQIRAERVRSVPAYMRTGLKPLLAILLCLISSAAAFGGTVSGTVRNATTGQPVSGADVILIQLQGGMQPVANTKTDAQGHFQFDRPEIGGAPMLLRAVYRGVNYHEPLPPGKSMADVQVFDPTDKPGSIAITTHALIVQPNGPELLVGEEYTIENKTQPPKAFYREDGSFNFSIPDGAQMNQASAWGSAGMPVVQGTIDKGKNQMAIAYAFRPGTSGVRISYKMPYTENRLTLRNKSPYATGRLIVAAPPSVQISGDGLSAAGQDQGFSVYVRQSVGAGDAINLNVSGTAPMGSPNSGGASNGAESAGGQPGDAGQNPSVNSRADSGGDASVATATAIPARLDSLKWILVGGFAAIFALGFVYLLRRPQMAMSTASAGGGSVSVSAPAPQRRPAPSRPAASSAVVAEVDSAVSGSLDALKDSFFRLELRRQAGTISEADYARERQRMEKTLRDLVRG
jgi:hypothetical protein